MFTTVNLRPAFGAYREVVHVSGVMAIGVFQPMLLSVRIKVGACRLEIRRLAQRLLMEMKSVYPGRQIMKGRLDGYAR